MSFLKHYKCFVRLICLVGINPFSINSDNTKAITTSWNVCYSSAYFVLVTVFALQTAYIRYSRTFNTSIRCLTVITESGMNIFIYACTMYLFVRHRRRQAKLINRIQAVDGKIGKYFNLQPQNGRFFRCLLTLTCVAAGLFLTFKFTLMRIYLSNVPDPWFVYTTIWIHLTLVVVVMNITGIGDMLTCRFDMISMVLRSMSWIIDKRMAKYSDVMAQTINRVSDVLMDLCHCKAALTKSFGVEILLNQTIDLFCLTIQGFIFFRHHEGRPIAYLIVKMTPIMVKNYFLVRRLGFLGCKVFGAVVRKRTELFCSWDTNRAKPYKC